MPWSARIPNTLTSYLLRDIAGSLFRNCPQPGFPHTEARRYHHWTQASVHGDKGESPGKGGSDLEKCWRQVKILVQFDKAYVRVG